MGVAMSWVIERLTAAHERDGFSCGNSILDEFLTKYATQYEKRNVARTHVLVRPGEAKVLGYYSLASSAVPFESFPASLAKKLPRHPVPVVLLARLAVDQSVRGQGHGGLLLRDAFTKCLTLGEQIGLFAVTVDAIDDAAVKFYQHFGFVLFNDQTDKLFISIDTIRQAHTG
jgi:GNAT superfamily N-acetyltransferase